MVSIHFVNKTMHPLDTNEQCRDALKAFLAIKRDAVDPLILRDTSFSMNNMQNLFNHWQGDVYADVTSILSETVEVDRFIYMGIIRALLGSMSEIIPGKENSVKHMKLLETILSKKPANITPEELGQWQLFPFHMLNTVTYCNHVENEKEAYTLVSRCFDLYWSVHKNHEHQNGNALEYCMGQKYGPNYWVGPILLDGFLSQGVEINAAIQASIDRIPAAKNLLNARNGIESTERVARYVPLNPENQITAIRGISGLNKDGHTSEQSI